MAKKQFYDIKYPFISQDEERYFVDLNQDMKSKIKSMLIHLIFTPKGQKIRDMEFGTNLVRFIYEVNDNETWENVKNEIKMVVRKYIDNVEINDISILPIENDINDIFVRLDYSIINGKRIETDSLITKI